MASTNTDAPFVETNDVDQGLVLPTSALNSEVSTGSAIKSPQIEYDNENAPLLDPRHRDDERDDGAGSENGDDEWLGMTDFRGLPWWKRPSIYWLLPSFLLFSLAFGAVTIPKMNLIMDLICDEYYMSLESDPITGPIGLESDRCQNDEVASRSSLFFLYGSLCAGMLAAITSPTLGQLSDRYGRRRFMALNSCGALVGELITILAAKFPETVHVNWILVGYCMEGLAGSFIVGMALAHSYASDCVPPQRRNTAFSYIHACLFTGIAIGPALSGYIIEERKKYVSQTDAVLFIFYLALGTHLCFIAFLTFCIPESLSKSRQEAAREKHRRDLERMGPASDWINQLRSANLFRPLKILWPTGSGSSSAVRWNLALLATTDTIVFGVAMGAMNVILVYARRQFGWRELESGRFASIVNTCRTLALLIIVPLLTRIFRGKKDTKPKRRSGIDLFDLSIIRVAILFDTCGYLGYALVRKGSLFSLSGALAAVGGISSPALGAALTKHVPPDQIGQLLGAMGLLHAVARVVGPVIFNGIFSATVGTYRQTVFVSLAATFGLAFVCSWFITPHVHIEENDDTPTN